MFRVWRPAVFQPLLHAGRENSEADTHVESFGDVLSDAGSTPAASTNFPSRVRRAEVLTLPTHIASKHCPSRAGASATLPYLFASTVDHIPRGSRLTDWDTEDGWVQALATSPGRWKRVHALKLCCTSAAAP